jgi:hypothetical protein
MAQQQTEEDKQKGWYFDQDVEDAIVRYNESDDPIERSKIYREEIDPALHKLCEVQVNINNFSHFDTNKEDFIQRIKTHLVKNLWRFDPDEGKAFSYYSWIARNKGIELDNKTYDKQKENVSIDNEESHLELEADTRDPVQNEMEQFMELFIEYWEDRMYEEFSKRRDLRIAEAILDIFRKRKSIDCYRKRPLYTMIRDYSGVEKAQYITNVVKTFKAHYEKAIKRFRNTGSIEPEDPSAEFFE